MAGVFLPGIHQAHGQAESHIHSYQIVSTSRAFYKALQLIKKPRTSWYQKHGSSFSASICSARMQGHGSRYIHTSWFLLLGPCTKLFNASKNLGSVENKNMEVIYLLQSESMHAKSQLQLDQYQSISTSRALHDTFQRIKKPGMAGYREYGSRFSR